MPGDPHQRGDGREGHRQECPPGGLHHRRQDGHLGDHRPRRGGGVLHGLRPRRRPPDPGPAGLQHPSPVRGGEQHRHHRHLDQRRQHGCPHGGQADRRDPGLSGSGEGVHRRRGGPGRPPDSQGHRDDPRRRGGCPGKEGAGLPHRGRDSHRPGARGRLRHPR